MKIWCGVLITLVCLFLPGVLATTIIYNTPAVGPVLNASVTAGTGIVVTGNGTVIVISFDTVWGALQYYPYATNPAGFFNITTLPATICAPGNASFWNGSDFTCVNLLSGPPGPQGPPGINGTNGANGLNGESSNITVINNGDGTYTWVFTYTNGTNYANFTTSNLTGPQGIQGVPGVNGTNGLNGTNGQNANLSNIFAGTGINITGNNSNITVSINLSNGSGINITGNIISRRVVAANLIMTNVTYSTVSGYSGPLLFNSEEFDTDNMHDTVNNSSRITVPETGFYLVNAQASWLSSPQIGLRGIRVDVNGVFHGTNFFVPNNGTESGNGLSDIVYLNASDYVEMQTYQSTTGNLSLLTLPSRTYFQVMKG